MVIVDDHLALVALNGRRLLGWGRHVPVLPWTLHVRLLRALLDSRAVGRLSQGVQGSLLNAALSPPPGVLEILDPRPYTEAVAWLKIEHGLSLVAAELLAAALAMGGEVHVVEGNVGRSWDAVLANTPVKLHVYARSDLD